MFRIRESTIYIIVGSVHASAIPITHKFISIVESTGEPHH